MRIKKFIKRLVILGIILIVLFSIYGAFSKLLDFGASNTVIDEVYSPDNNYKAIIFERDAGATTGFSTQVSIISSKSSLPNSPGNVFISDTNHGSAPSGKGGGPEVSISWVNSNEVIISYHSKARIFKEEGSIKNIQIRYTYCNELLFD